MILAIILIIVFYLLPAFSVYRYQVLAYSEDGIWYDTSYDMFFFWLMVIPVVNIAAFFALWFDEHPLSNKKKGLYEEIAEYIGEKFFNVKR